MMNKKILVLALLLFLIAGGIYYLKMRPASPTSHQSTGSLQSEAVQFAEAIASGKPTTCILTKDKDQMEYHMRGKLMAANINSEIGGQTTTSHMINDGAYIYIWSDDHKQGTKMTIPTETETQATTDKAKQLEASAPKLEGEADYNAFKDQGYLIDCKSGGVDSSTFVPPADVTFTDPTAMMPQFTNPDSEQLDYNKLQEQYGAMSRTDTPDTNK